MEWPRAGLDSMPVVGGPHGLVGDGELLDHAEAALERAELLPPGSAGRARAVAACGALMAELYQRWGGGDAPRRAGVLPGWDEASHDHADDSRGAA